MLRVTDSGKCIGCYSCMLACARVAHHSFSPRKSALQVYTQGGLQGRFVIDACKGCTEPPCIEDCPNEALILRSGGGVKLVADNCTGCGNCANACPVGGIRIEDGVALVCTHCGVCAEFCPHGVLTSY